MDDFQAIHNKIQTLLSASKVELRAPFKAEPEAEVSPSKCDLYDIFSEPGAGTIDDVGILGDVSSRSDPCDSGIVDPVVHTETGGSCSNIEDTVKKAANEYDILKSWTRFASRVRLVNAAFHLPRRCRGNVACEGRCIFCDRLAPTWAVAGSGWNGKTTRMLPELSVSVWRTMQDAKTSSADSVDTESAAKWPPKSNNSLRRARQKERQMTRRTARVMM